MIELKTPKEIEEMKPAGRFVGGILRDLKEFTKVGTNLLEIDEFVHKRIVDRKGAIRYSILGEVDWDAPAHLASLTRLLVAR